MLDLKRLDKGLESCPELSHRTEGIFLLDGAGRDVPLVDEDVGGQHLLIAPELTELHILIDDAAGAVFPDKPVDWASLGTTSGSGSKNSIILSYSANQETSLRTLTVVATASGGKKTASATLTQQGYVAPAPSGQANGGKAASAPYKWLELPATDAADGMDFLWHMVDVGGKKIRNYSCYWNYNDLVSIWVAYPLNSKYSSGTTWDYKWGVDPLLSNDVQSVLYSGYRQGNNTSLSGAFYARGHQIARADRRICQDASDQTCYGTNMTPQLNKGDGGTMDFNGGIWANLESRVRDKWAASSDTLYVVTGCVLDGAKYYALDNMGKKVTVPTAYYKAVLRYTSSSSSTGLGYSGYMACAVWLEHKLYSTSAKVDKTYAMSIDALEQKLGIDQFGDAKPLPEKELAVVVETARSIAGRRECFARHSRCHKVYATLWTIRQYLFFRNFTDVAVYHMDFGMVRRIRFDA